MDVRLHLPCHESDHVLSLGYNAMLQGVRLQDTELRRNDEAFLDALRAQRIPDPTTSGDFTWRFSHADIAAKLCMTRQKAGRWRDRYVRLGLASIEKDAPCPGRLSRYGRKQIEQIVRKTLEERPVGATHGSRRGERIERLDGRADLAQARAEAASDAHLQVLRKAFSIALLSRPPPEPRRSQPSLRAIIFTVNAS